MTTRAACTAVGSPFCRRFGSSLPPLLPQFGVSQVLCCRLGAVCRPCFWPSGARRPCRQSWRVAAALITLGTTGLGMAQGGRVEGSMLPGTQRLAVSSLPVSGRPSACAAASGQVMSFRASFGPHLSPASAPHFLSTSSDPLDPRINHPAIRPLPLVPGRPLGTLETRIASTPPSLKNKEGFQQGRRVSDHVSVLIGHFSCAAVAQSASSWGQARLGAVTDAPCRTAAANLGGEYRLSFSKKA